MHDVNTVLKLMLQSTRFLWTLNNMPALPTFGFTILCSAQLEQPYPMITPSSFKELAPGLVSRASSAWEAAGSADAAKWPFRSGHACRRGKAVVADNPPKLGGYCLSVLARESLGWDGLRPCGSTMYRVALQCRDMQKPAQAILDEAAEVCQAAATYVPLSSFQPHRVPEPNRAVKKSNNTP